MCSDCTSTAPDRPAPRRTRYRKFPIEPLEIAVADLPPDLEGLTVCHLSDLHVRGPWKRFDRLIQTLADSAPADVLAITGDLVADVGCESACHQVVRDILRAARPNVGSFCVFGNHDTAAIRQRLEHLPIHRLIDRAWRDEQRPLTLLGVDCGPSLMFGDLLAALNDESTAGNNHRLRILLAHRPDWLVPASDAGIDLVLSGHTHGGQCRLPGLRPIYVGDGPWPCRWYSGLFRRGRTTLVLSRGIGDQAVNGLRLFCPPQALRITLRRDNNPPPPSETVQVIRKW